MKKPITLINSFGHSIKVLFKRGLGKHRDIDLIMDLCSQLELLVEDDGLTADELKKLAP